MGAGRQGSQKWALLIGVKDYPVWREEYPERDDLQLRAPVNDVDAIQKLLTSEQFGFPQENVLTLTSPADEKRKRPLASRDNILNAFRTHLIENEKIRPGDVVVIYYSGHGSWIRDRHHDEEVDDVDGLLLPRDETLVPCDSGSDHARDIIDDEIAELLEQLAELTRNINLFFDSCNSGTITRALPEDEQDVEGRARWLPPPPGDYVATAHLERKGAGGWLSPNDNYVVISACHASERSREKRFMLKGLKWYGIMTYCLLDVLSDVDPETTYYDIWENLKVRVNRINPDQTPQIEGAFEREVFGGATLPRKRYVEVVQKSDDVIALAVGLVHGVTAGSRFAIYQKGTQTFEDKTARLAVVKLTGVDAFTSAGIVTEGTISKVESGAPAIEIEHKYGAMQMVVRVVGDDRILDAVRQIVKESPLLVLAETDEQPSTVIVWLRYPRRPDGSQDVSYGKMLCIVGSSDGCILVEPIAPDTTGPGKMCQKLDDIAKCRNLLAIRNADPQSKLKGKIKLHLLKKIGQDENGDDITEPVERDEGGNIALKVGDRVYIEVENQSDRNLHVAIFNCQSNWEVGPIFPKPGATDDRVSAQDSRKTMRFRVGWPDGHPKPQTEEEKHNLALLPHDTVKVFATTEQVDFRGFWLSKTRAMEDRTSLPRLIGLAAGGGSMRVTRSMDRGEEDWSTDQLVFRITP